MIIPFAASRKLGKMLCDAQVYRKELMMHQPTW